MKRLMIVIITMALLAGCSSMSIQADFSESADFASFKTFEYAESNRTLADAAPLAHGRIVAAIKREMTASGFTVVDSDADVRVSYFASINERLQFNTTYTGMSGWGRHGRAGMGMATSSTRASTFEEGTLVVDVWQADGNELVWRGVMQDTIRDDPDRNTERLNRGMSRLFEDFPPS